jgi:hypothetical protein
MRFDRTAWGAASSDHTISATQCGSKRSLVAVSQKWEYSGMLPETFSVCVPQGAKFGARRPIASSQKPAVGGHFYDNQGLRL